MQNISWSNLHTLAYKKTILELIQGTKKSQKPCQNSAEIKNHQKHQISTFHYIASNWPFCNIPSKYLKQKFKHITNDVLKVYLSLKTGLKPHIPKSQSHMNWSSEAEESRLQKSRPRVSKDP